MGELRDAGKRHTKGLRSGHSSAPTILASSGTSAREGWLLDVQRAAGNRAVALAIGRSSDPGGGRSRGEQERRVRQAIGQWTAAGLLSVQREETWYRGQAAGVGRMKPGAAVHDLGDGMYLTDSLEHAGTYAQQRGDKAKQKGFVRQVNFKRPFLGKVLDLTADARWKAFLSEPGWMKGMTMKQYASRGSELYNNVFNEFLRRNNLKLDTYDAVIGEDLIKNPQHKQLCIRNPGLQADVEKKLSWLGVPRGRSPAGGTAGGTHKPIPAGTKAPGAPVSSQGSRGTVVTRGGTRSVPGGKAVAGTIKIPSKLRMRLRQGAPMLGGLAWGFVLGMFTDYLRSRIRAYFERRKFERIWNERIVPQLTAAATEEKLIEIHRQSPSSVIYSAANIELKYYGSPKRRRPSSNPHVKDRSRHFKREWNPSRMYLMDVDLLGSRLTTEDVRRQGAIRKDPYEGRVWVPMTLAFPLARGRIVEEGSDEVRQRLKDEADELRSIITALQRLKTQNAQAVATLSQGLGGIAQDVTGTRAAVIKGYGLLWVVLRLVGDDLAAASDPRGDWILHRLEGVESRTGAVLADWPSELIDV